MTKVNRSKIYLTNGTARVISKGMGAMRYLYTSPTIRIKFIFYTHNHKGGRYKANETLREHIIANPPHNYLTNVDDEMLNELLCEQDHSQIDNITLYDIING